MNALSSGTGHVIAIDGGGTASRVAVADGKGKEILRHVGPPGLVDPRDPEATVRSLLGVIRDAAAEADVELPVEGLCAGLAGVGDRPLREKVRSALARDGVARRVDVVPDGEIALHGALGDEPGVLLIAGTGSIAYARGPDGQVERCGGWGIILGDDGSGYDIARSALAASLRAHDGRGRRTELLPTVLSALDLADPSGIPSWVGRASKAEVAALAPRVLELADEGDAVATDIVEAAAGALVRHVTALLQRIGTWAPVVVVFHGGVLSTPAYARRVEARLATLPVPAQRRDPRADAITGAIRMAIRNRTVVER